MKKKLFPSLPLAIALAALLLLAAKPVHAAGAAPVLSIVLPSGTPLSAERLVYNALDATGTSFSMEETRNSTNAFGAVLAGEADIALGPAVLTQAEYGDSLERIDIPLGAAGSATTYCWYSSARPEVGALLTEGLAAIRENGVFERILARQSVDASNPKVVFQLSSYSTEMIWESQAEQALRETLAGYDEPISLYIHNMNFRQTNFRTAQYDTATSFVRSSFMSEYPDVIIAMDNDALGYLQENYGRLFEGVPVVFCGINGYDESLISELTPHATGISEYIDPTETVEFALRANPGLNRIYTVFDETSSASPVKAALLETIEEKYGGSM